MLVQWVGAIEIQRIQSVGAAGVGVALDFS
jgi:hypothetical protein